MTEETTTRQPAFDTSWLWVLVAFFVGGEWLIIFHPDLRSSFNFLRQMPESFSCPDSLAEAALDFFNFKVWVIVSLSQAVVWGVVACVSLRWLVDLWNTGEAAGRWRRVLTIGVRSVLFGFGLWFFLTPAPQWHAGCFSGHVSVRASGVLAYVAVGVSAIVMWVLENRVCSLRLEQGRLAATLRYLDLRHKLQILLLMASLVLGFGVIGLMTRRSFLHAISPQSFFPSSIVLEGFEYTVLLALAYAPVHAAFNAMGVRVRDALIPVPANDDAEEIQHWAQLCDDINELMQIRVYDWKSFGPGFPILAPFLLSLISGLVRS